MKKALLIILSLALVVINSSCGGGGDSVTGSYGKSNVTIKISGPESVANSGTRNPRSAQVPSFVSTISFSITARDMVPIERTISVAGREVITESFLVPNGHNRHIVINAMTDVGVVIYTWDHFFDLGGTPLHLDANMVPTSDKTAPSFGGLSSITSITETSMVLSWSPANDIITPQEKIQYLIYRADSPGAENYSSPTYTTAGQTTFIATGLKPNRTYYFVVRAKDEAGNEDNNTTEKSAQTKGVTTAIDVTNPCPDAIKPDSPINISAVVRNTGTETLTNITCTNDKTKVLNGVPSSLETDQSATVTGSYYPGQTNPSTNTLRCQGTGALSGTRVEDSEQAICTFAIPGISVKATCSDNRDYYGCIQSVSVSATVTNTGNETLNSLTCFDDKISALSGVPASLDPGKSGTVTGSYSAPDYCISSLLTDRLTCSGIGAISKSQVASTASSTCNFITDMKVDDICSLRSTQFGPWVDVYLRLFVLGNEDLANVTCSSVPSVSPAFPSISLPGGLGYDVLAGTMFSSYPASYNPPYSNEVTCQATGQLSGKSITRKDSCCCGESGATAPVPCYPANGATVTIVTPALQWYTSSGSATIGISYEVQICKGTSCSSNYSNTVIFEKNPVLTSGTCGGASAAAYIPPPAVIAALSWNVYPPLSRGVYSWRVRTVASGCSGDWSETRTFTVQ